MTAEAVPLGSSRADAMWTYALLGGAGALVLGTAPLLVGWLGGLPFVPFQDALRWVGGFDDPWTWVARPAVGLVLGAAAAWWVLYDEHRLLVGRDDVVVIHRDDRRRVARDTVVGVHRDGRTVVIDGRDGRRVFEARVESSRARVREAFTTHGYPYESE